MTEPRVTVGFVKRAHGIRGGVLVSSTSDHPGRFSPGSVLRVSGSAEDVAVVGSQPHTEGIILYLDGVTDRTTAEALRHHSLTIAPAARRPLTGDEWWPEDLVGRPAVTPDGARLGTVTDVVLGGAQDRLVVATPDGRIVEVPFVAALVPDVTAEAVTIDPPEGLFDPD